MALACLLAAPAAPARAQSGSVADYVALAQQELRWTHLAVSGGDLGAIGGAVVSRGVLSAPASRLVATKVAIDSTATCARVFAHDASGTSATCPLAAGSPLPAFMADEIAELCTPPGGFTCASPTPMIVARDTVVTLPPGAYGDVLVEGGAGGAGTLRLAGDYQFCSLRVLRHGAVVFDGPSHLVVAGTVTTGTGASITPAGVTPAQVTIQALGPIVRFSRGSRIGARVCTLSGLAKATAIDLSGQLVAGRIRLKRSSLHLDATPPTTTTTSTSSTSSTSTSSTSTSTSSSTTLPPVCGNGILEPGEECDGEDFGGLTCADVSTAGAFVDSAGGGFLSCRADCTIDTSTCITEICGNCIDDDGNGLTDFEDPACCTGEARFAQVLKKGRLKANKKKAGTRVKLKAILWSSTQAQVDPTSEDVYVQARESNGNSLFCARLPASAFRQKKNGKQAFRFRDKRGLVNGAGGLQRVSIRVDKDGMTRFKATGKHTVFTLPDAGPLEITVAFLPPSGVPGEAPRCSAAVRAFRATKRAGLRFP